MKLNGCHNRAKFPEKVSFTDIELSGICELQVVRNTYPFRFARDCMYDKKLTDKRCIGCRWL